MERSISFRMIISALFGVFCLCASATVAIDDNSSIDSDTVQSDLIAWVRSKGGSFSDKLEIRRVDPEDPTSYMGVFVKEPIDAKESLFVVPRNCYIDVFDTASEMVPEDMNVMDLYYENLCQLATKLNGEINRGETSAYAPYTAYLKTQTPGQLPANWSPKGKDLLRKVAFPGSDMVDWIEWDFKGEKNDCIGALRKINNGNDNDNSNSNANYNNGQNNEGSSISFEEHIVEMTKQRCFDTALIPLWDMVNHDNGRINTETDTMYDPEGLKVRALRDLEAGEEVFSTYDKCLDCLGVEEYWGTPEMLRDFGFVENYPHRWVFRDGEIWIEVTEDLDFDTHFHEDGNDSETPTENHMAFLKEELARLEAVGESFLGENTNGVPDREWSTINAFFLAATVDLDEVIDWFESAAGDDDDDDDDDDSNAEDLGEL